MMIAERNPQRSSYAFYSMGLENSSALRGMESDLFGFEIAVGAHDASLDIEAYPHLELIYVTAETHRWPTLFETLGVAARKARLKRHPNPVAIESMDWDMRLSVRA